MLVDGATFGLAAMRRVRISDFLTPSFADDRHFRTRFLPMTVRKVYSDGKPAVKPGDRRDNEIEGVIGVIMDVTEVKAKEAVLAAQAKEKQQLLANEAAAKEASRLKSQFLANVSIRRQMRGECLADFSQDTDVT